MKISYNWLKEYLDFKEDHESIGEKLTSLGLEVEGIKKFQSIPGGLEGVVIGKTKSIKKHPNADRLKITTVDIGQNELIQIICGAPNVDKNQTEKIFNHPLPRIRDSLDKFRFIFPSFVQK